jgi:hypothetical protein
MAGPRDSSLHRVWRVRSTVFPADHQPWVFPRPNALDSWREVFNHASDSHRFDPGRPGGDPKESADLVRSRQLPPRPLASASVDEEGADALIGNLDERQAERDQHPLERGQRPAGTQAIAGLVLATVSLIGIGPADLFGQSLISHTNDLRGLSAAPGIAAVVAAIGAWLGRRELVSSEPAWTRPLAAAAIGVGVLAFIVNLIAFVGLMTSSHGGFVGG